MSRCDGSLSRSTERWAAIIRCCSFRQHMEGVAALAPGGFDYWDSRRHGGTRKRLSAIPAGATDIGLGLQKGSGIK